MRWMLVVALALVPLGCEACGARQYAVRDSETFATETGAALARQEEAADALFEAATAARDAGDVEACERYAKPALLIRAKARAQAWRALWLAGLPYPNPDGTVPDVGTAQPDPGVSGPVEPVSSVCDVTSPVGG